MYYYMQGKGSRLPGPLVEAFSVLAFIVANQKGLQGERPIRGTVPLALSVVCWRE
jgi:hypothetical protein